MSYQQITIVGRLGSDPEMRYTQSGKAVTNLSVATSKHWTDNNGQKQEKTVWFRVSAWEKLAEIAAQHLAKGREVLIVGEVKEPNIWTDRDGNARANLEVEARNITFLGSKKDYEGVQDNSVAARSAMHKSEANHAAPAQQTATLPVPRNDEEIPF